MIGTRAAAAALLALALPTLVPVPAPGREPRVILSSFPGPPQPDPGTDAAPSRNGRVVAFAASARENGDRYDPAATPTVFLWDRRLGSLRQVTASGPSDEPSAAHGSFLVPVGTATVKTLLSRSLVAFRSTANLAGRNADGSAEIFVWDSQTGAVTQITDAASGASSDPAIGAQFQAETDANGRYTGKVLVRYRVAFLSTSDLAGDNPGALAQVFLHDSGLPEVGRLAQVSHSATGAAGPPAVDGTGDRFAFLHDGALLPGDDAGVAEVYTYDRRQGLRHAVHDVDGDSPGWDTAADVAIDGSGRYVAFSWAGGALPERDIVECDTLSGRFRMLVTGGSGDLRAPSYGRGRGRMALLSTASLPAPVPERPVVVLHGRRTVEAAPPGPAYGRPLLAGSRREFLFTSDGNLDGTNAAGRTVLYQVGFRP